MLHRCQLGAAEFYFTVKTGKANRKMTDEVGFKKKSLRDRGDATAVLEQDRIFFAGAELLPSVSFSDRGIGRGPAASDSSCT